MSTVTWHLHCAQRSEAGQFPSTERFVQPPAHLQQRCALLSTVEKRKWNTFNRKPLKGADICETPESKFELIITLLVWLAAASDNVRACREKQQRHVKRSCALTSLNNQSAHLDVDEKQSISGEGALWLALISTSSLNQALLSLFLPRYDIDDSHLHQWHWWRWLSNTFLHLCPHFSVAERIQRLAVVQGVNISVHTPKLLGRA